MQKNNFQTTSVGLSDNLNEPPQTTTNKLVHLNQVSITTSGIIHLVRTHNFPKNNISYPTYAHVRVSIRG